MTPSELGRLIRDVPDFPRPGILFKDLTPVFADAAAMRALADLLTRPWEGSSCTKVIGIEARGFLLAPLVAERLGVGIVPVRKPGKLPWTTRRMEYALEYGSDSLEMHSDALAAGDVVIVIDDVLATGGTAAAVAALVRESGARLAGLGFVVEIEPLGGRSSLVAAGVGADVHSVVAYA